ncbi:MAG TPA: arsinothricin resistance N-acetyltransferase ArsN1 family B [Bryobacteraceae bacterium]|jgi:phosphinothricin acetyltransferase|nr:arsinothricin resistance N-acetyltransferase ArsN1 family B [Bryobacteraceae bacterium]
MTIRPAAPADAPLFTAIYNHYVTQTVITFEEEPVSADEMAKCMAEVQQAGLPWLVVETAGQLAGYAYATPWRTRSAYRFSVEITIYLTSSQTGAGLGSLLLSELRSGLRERGIHAAIGGIALPNEPSIRLHEKLGFRKVAEFPQVGFKFGRWIDVGYWQCIL